jgi:rubrerythrin
MGQLNSLELLRESMRVEHDGIMFYRKAARLSKTRPVQKLFKKLADEELNHLEKLELVYDSLAETDEWLVDKDLLESAPKNLKDVEAYEEEIQFDNDLDELGMIERGIRAEEDSIRLYRKAMEDCKSGDKRGCIMFDWLIKLEKGHLAALKDMRNAVVGS